MSRLPRYQPDAKVKGSDLNLILAILDTGGVINPSSATNSGVSGDSLSPSTPNVSGSISANPGAVGAPVTPRGFTGIFGIDNFAQTHTAYVILSWTPNPVTDFVSRYDIYYHKGSDPTLYNLTVGGDVNSVRVNNLFPGNTYSFAIQAHDAANRASLWTTELTVVISPDSDPPAVPTGLVATGFVKSIFLTWTEVGPEGLSNDLKQYQIQIDTDPAFGAAPFIATVGPGNHLYYPYASSGTVLYARIRTADWTGNVSDWSANVNATTG